MRSKQHKKQKGGSNFISTRSSRSLRPSLTATPRSHNNNNHHTGGIGLGPALKLAGAATAVASTTKHIYITYFFMFVILALIAWIIYMIKDKDSTKNNRDTLPITTATGTLAYSSPPVPSSANVASSVQLPSAPIIMLNSPGGNRHDPFESPYEPPLKNDGMYFPTDSSDVRGVPLIGSMKAMMGFGDGPAKCNSGLCHAPPPQQQEAAPPGWPVNMMTRGYAPEFSQIGILTHERGGKGDNSLNDNMILPLFGRRIMNGRDKYQYYSLSNTGAVNTKLPVLVRGRNCIGEYGCDQIYNGDTVYVQGYNNNFTATVYENSLFSYIPFL